MKQGEKKDRGKYDLHSIAASAKHDEPVPSHAQRESNVKGRRNGIVKQDKRVRKTEKRRKREREVRARSIERQYNVTRPQRRDEESPHVMDQSRSCSLHSTDRYYSTLLYILRMILDLLISFITDTIHRQSAVSAHSHRDHP